MSRHRNKYGMSRYLQSSLPGGLVETRLTEASIIGYHSANPTYLCTHGCRSNLRCGHQMPGIAWARVRSVVLPLRCPSP